MGVRKWLIEKMGLYTLDDLMESSKCLLDVSEKQIDGSLLGQAETAKAISESKRRGNRSVHTVTRKVINGVPVIHYGKTRIERTRKPRKADQ